MNNNCNISYYMFICNSKNPQFIRQKMVERYHQTLNYSQVAREFNTRRQTVKFWVKQYEEQDLEGLKNKSRALNKISHKPPKWIEEKIIKIAKSRRCWIGQEFYDVEI